MTSKCKRRQTTRVSTCRQIENEGQRSKRSEYWESTCKTTSTTTRRTKVIEKWKEKDCSNAWESTRLWWWWWWRWVLVVVAMSADKGTTDTKRRQASRTVASVSNDGTKVPMKLLTMMTMLRMKKSAELSWGRVLAFNLISKRHVSKGKRSQKKRMDEKKQKSGGKSRLVKMTTSARKPEKRQSKQTTGSGDGRQKKVNEIKIDLKSQHHHHHRTMKPSQKELHDQNRRHGERKGKVFDFVFDYFRIG